MSQVPMVSVIMPAYNAEPFISEAIDSILAQTFDNFELIILDDGSHDNTASIVLSYQDSRIRFIHKENEGVARTLNKGVREAKGEFIWRHDADDISLPDKLQLEMEFMAKHPNCLLVATQVAFMTERGKVAWNKKQPKDNWLGKEGHKWVTFEDFSPYSPITHGTALIRACAFEKAGLYREAFITSEDIDMWLRMMDHGKLAVLNQCLSLHRISSASATAVHGWKNEFYRELAKQYWNQRQINIHDDLEVNGCIVEPESPTLKKPDSPMPGKTFRSDLLNFHYAVHIDAGDWAEVIRIIRIAMADGWRLKMVYRALLIPILPIPVVHFIVKLKGAFR